MKNVRSSQPCILKNSCSESRSSMRASLTIRLQSPQTYDGLRVCYHVLLYVSYYTIESK